MKEKILGVMVIVLLVIVVIQCGEDSKVTSPLADGNVAGQVWEYRIGEGIYPAELRDNPDTISRYEEKANLLGADGWEAVAIIGSGSWVHILFKRPK